MCCLSLQVLHFKGAVYMSLPLSNDNLKIVHKANAVFSRD
jgi:hypothetical protein